MKTTAPTTEELRMAYERAPLLRLAGWTFERACANRLVLWSLNHSAIAFRRHHHLPSQPRLL